MVRLSTSSPEPFSGDRPLEPVAASAANPNADIPGRADGRTGEGGALGAALRWPLRYAVRHWRGELSLGQAFWINLVAVRAGLTMADDLFKPPFIDHVGDHLGVALAFSIFSTFIVFPWQVVGVLRAGDRLAGQPGAAANVICSQIGIVLAALATLVSPYAIFQPLVAEPPGEPKYLEWERERAGKYVIAVDETGRELAISGELEIGLTRAVRETLAANPGISVVVLDSGGGFVNQGRALARVIGEYGLDTFVGGECTSACTIAFAAGENRWIGEAARIGFHRYRYAGAMAHPTVDSDAEQARDRAFFLSRGVAAEFLDRAFEADYSVVWYPSAAELQAAELVHGVAARPFTPR